MKRMISFLCTLAIVLLYVPAIPRASASNLKEIQQNSPFRMSVLGDSIAAGYGLEGYDRDKEPCYECASYANLLAKKYELVSGVTYYNFAASGATTSDLITTLGDDSIMNTVKNSDTILISIGGNDLLAVLWSAGEGIVTEGEDGSGFSFDAMQFMDALSSFQDDIDAALEGFENNFDIIINMIREKNPNALVIVNTLYDPFQGSETFKPITQISSGALEKFNTIIKNNATDSNGNTRYTVVDVAAGFEGNEAELTNIGGYDIHPSAEGHELIAQLLDEEIVSHTFTTWVLDTSASAESQYSEEEKQEAKSFATLMFGFFFMLVIMITVLFVHSLNKLKKQ